MDSSHSVLPVESMRALPPALANSRNRKLARRRGPLRIQTGRMRTRIAPQPQASKEHQAENSSSSSPLIDEELGTLPGKVLLHGFAGRRLGCISNRVRMVTPSMRSNWEHSGERLQKCLRQRSREESNPAGRKWRADACRVIESRARFYGNKPRTMVASATRPTARIYAPVRMWT